MGIHIYDFGDFRGSFFCFFSIVLCDFFWRRLLGLDRHPDFVCDSGRFVRIQEKAK